jgi:CheY-like chemotaxis protein
MPDNSSTDILLVEDNPGDIRLITDALKDAAVQPRLNIVRDGVEAIQFLRQKGQYDHAPRPVMVKSPT